MKNTLYFTVKAFFVLKIFKFLSYILVMQKNDLIRKKIFILKFMTSKPGKQTITIHISSNISRSKLQSDNEIRSVNERHHETHFLEKSYTKCGRETIPRPFFKKSELSIFLDQQSKVLRNLFLLYAKQRTIGRY